MQDKSKNKIKKKGKKAQEEMLGFMLIVVIVIVVGLVLLFLIKPKKAELENVQIDNMIYSALSYTAGDKSVRDLIAEDCYEGDEEACEFVEKTLKDILDVALKESNLVVGQQLYGYSLNVTNCDIPLITKGNLTGNMFGSYTPVTRDIVIISEFYY